MCLGSNQRLLTAFSPSRAVRRASNSGEVKYSSPDVLKDDTNSSTLFLFPSSTFSRSCEVGVYTIAGGLRRLGQERRSTARFASGAIGTTSRAKSKIPRSRRFTIKSAIRTCSIYTHWRRRNTKTKRESLKPLFGPHGCCDLQAGFHSLS